MGHPETLHTSVYSDVSTKIKIAGYMVLPLESVKPELPDYIFVRVLNENVTQIQ